MSFNIRLGEKVTWTSQAGGHSRTKTGEVIGYVLKNSSINEAIKTYLVAKQEGPVASSNVHALTCACDDRYLIVVRSPKGIPHFHAVGTRRFEKQVEAERVRQDRREGARARSV